MVGPGDNEKDEEGRRRPVARARARPEHRRRILTALLLAALVAFAIDSAVGPSHELSGADAIAEKEAPSPWQQARGRLEHESAIVDRTLRNALYVSRGNDARPNVALTFDDGPGSETPAILEILGRFDAKATFFSLGSAVGEHPQQNRAELLAGHAIGNHTFDHPRLAGLPPEEQERQIDATTEALRKEGLKSARLFRPPFGSFDATTLELLRKRRQLMVLWSLDATDFGGSDSTGIAARVLDEIEPGSIVLMHDGGGDRSETVAALPAVLRGLEQRGLRAVTVPELLATNPPPRDQLPPTALDGLP